MERTVLEVRDLRTYFYLDEGTLKAVDGVSFDLKSNQTLGIIGESGCGKSVTAQSVLRIVPPPGRIVSGEIRLMIEEGDSRNIATMDPYGRPIRSIRGKTISMIFQEPMTSLSPVHTIGNQIMEAILLHRTQDKRDAREIAVDMINKVGIGNPLQRMDEYPAQLSGGMRQRAMIAMALSCDPDVLIADEPTTALDVTIQAQILDLLRGLQDQYGMAVLFITHDLGVIAEISEYVAVMYLGRIVEQGPVRRIFHSPLHPYTKSLLRSIPKLGRRSRQPLEVIEGTVPMPLDFPPMCGFYSRCPHATAGSCDQAIPALVPIEKNHYVRCFLHDETTETGFTELESRRATKRAAANAT